ncbi:MAG: hypothetical protein WCS77_02305 [Elusimicrobiaceae bacterium]
MKIRNTKIAIGLAAISSILLISGLHYQQRTNTGIKAIRTAACQPQYSLRSDILMTLVGVKPLSSNIRNGEELCSLTGREGKNANIICFRARDSLNIANKKALSRLSEDKTVAAVFKRHCLTFPHNPDEWISEYKRVMELREYDFEYYIVLGTVYGYAPLETEAFAWNIIPRIDQLFTELSNKSVLVKLLQESNVPIPENRNDWRKLIHHAAVAKKPLEWQRILLKTRDALPDIPKRTKFVGLNIPDFDFSPYARFTDRELERDTYYTQSQYQLSKNYEQLIKTNHNSLDIINNPQLLDTNLPTFPAKFLM